MPRRKSASGGMNLDSLMDTLTNVVGILLIILIFALLGGQEVVKKLKGFVDEVSDEQLAAAAAESEELRKLIELQRAKWEELEVRAPQEKLTLEAQQKLLEQLQADIARLSAAEIDPEALKQQLEERRKKAAELEAAIAEREQMLASLKARLAETPAQGAGAETKVVNLPDPRPAPAGAKAVTFLCRHGRIYPLATEALQREAQQVLNTSQRLLLKPDGIDCEKLKEIFGKRFIGDNFVQLGIRVGGDGKPALLVSPRADKGEETEKISRPTSQFNVALRSLNPQQQYIEFRVWSDSFDTYLVARNEAARKGISAGWTPYDEKGEYWIGFGIEFPTTCQGAKVTPPAAADPNRPPLPADTVD